MSNTLELTNKLYNLAIKSNQTSKYAAIIIHRNKIISIGFNYLTRISSLSPSCLL